MRMTMKTINEENLPKNTSVELLECKSKIKELEMIVEAFSKQRLTDSIEFTNLINEYNKIKNSRSWKYTQFIRNILDKIKKINHKSVFDPSIDYRNNIYNHWINKVEKDIYTYDMPSLPLITVIIPFNKLDDNKISISIDSIINQNYINWRLIVLYNDITKNELENYDEYKKNSKIKLIHCNNFVLDDIEGDLFGYLGCNDVLSLNALQEVALAYNLNDNVKIIYSDHDRLSSNNDKKHSPFFKPDYSPDTLLWQNYFSPFVFYKKELLSKNDLICNNLSLDYGFILKKTDNIARNEVYHIDKVLYHLREKGGINVKPPKTKRSSSTKIAEIENAIKRRRIKGYNIQSKSGNNIVYDDLNAGVSVIIPSKDNFYSLKKCVDSIIKITKYDNYEIIIVDNGSNVTNRTQIEQYSNNNNIKYIYFEMPFNFSYMCNMGSKYSSKEVLAFVNDDIEIKNPNWMSIMVGQAIQKKTGAVGAKLYYPNSNLIQHCGVGCYLGGPGHFLQGTADDVDHYFSRNLANYNVLAVTAACLFVEKNKFNKVGGFDNNFNVNYNDVDLCIRLYDAGYYNIVRNDVICIHHESFTRQPANALEIYKAKELLFDKNSKYRAHDPFYNKNLPQFSANFDYERELRVYNIE